MEDDDPRFKESKFLGFLSKVMKGELKITDDQIVEVKPEGQRKQQLSPQIHLRSPPYAHKRSLLFYIADPMQHALCRNDKFFQYNA